MAEENIQLIHESVLSFLIEKRKDQPDLRFALRRSNRFTRLDKGYWFYGNEYYLAISFWSGSDWKNKTPNIIFTITLEGNTYLELVASDSAKKEFFLSEELPAWVPDLKRGRKKLTKGYSTFAGDYLKSLDEFIKTEKIQIDQAILTKSHNYFDETDQTFNRIGFIDEKDFQSRLATVLQYRQRIQSNTPLALPNAIRSIRIKNLPPIIDLHIDNIPSNTKWIFFTGLNGKGKSSVLKAIAASLANNSDDSKSIITHPNFDITVKVQKGRKTFKKVFNSNTKYDPNFLVDGLAAYGASRLMVDSLDEILPAEQARSILTRSSALYSIFHADGLLLDLEKQLASWQKESRRGTSNWGNVEERISQIIELLPVIIPSLVSIHLPDKIDDRNDWKGTRYVEEDEFENKLPEVKFRELASGLRSMVAMLGDMMVRLFGQQPDVTDPSQLKGIVIIDELDVHLHPDLQKKLPRLLDGIFANVQFIVSTHSPIPLLGCPDNSVIYKVDRTLDRGVFVEEIKNLDIPNMLPNALLTSPVFGMDELTSSSNKDIKKVITAEHYDEQALFELVKKKSEEFLKKFNEL